VSNLLSLVLNTRLELLALLTSGVTEDFSDLSDIRAFRRPINSLLLLLLLLLLITPRTELNFAI